MPGTAYGKSVCVWGVHPESGYNSPCFKFSLLFMILSCCCWRVYERLQCNSTASLKCVCVCENRELSNLPQPLHVNHVEYKAARRERADWRGALRYRQWGQNPEISGNMSKHIQLARFPLDVFPITTPRAHVPSN